MDEKRIADTLRALADDIEAGNKPVVETIGKPFGTSHWSGTVNGQPAMTLSYYGGATLAIFGPNGWRFDKFDSLDKLHKHLGLPRYA